MYAKNIPECIKQQIKQQIRVEEYSCKEDIKKIYIFIDPPPFKVCLMGYDDNCNLFLVKSNEYDCRPLEPKEWMWGEMLPDRTIEYKEVVYYFKRNVFTKK